jgi:hypothetical protein
MSIFFLGLFSAFFEGFAVKIRRPVWKRRCDLKVYPRKSNGSSHTQHKRVLSG